MMRLQMEPLVVYGTTPDGFISSHTSGKDQQVLPVPWQLRRRSYHMAGVIDARHVGLQV